MCSTEWTRRAFVQNAAKLGAAAAVSPALLATGIGTARAATAPRSSTLASVTLTNVRVFNGRELTEPTSVTIEDGIIGFSPIGTTTVNANGATLLPGLIDSHVHLESVSTLQELTSYGVTTALDMACWPPSLVASLRDQAGLTDIRSAGIPAAEPGSVQSELPGFPQADLVTSVNQAWPFVTGRLAEGSDYIKIIVDVPGLSQEIIDALVLAAHAFGKAVMAHATSAEAIEVALTAGVDMIHHTPLDTALPASTVQQYVSGGHVSVPTLIMMQGFAELGIPGLSYAAAQGSVTELLNAGVTILAGTDSNLKPGIPVHPVFGAALHTELQLLVAAGLSNVQALRAATIAPAQAFGLGNRGAILPGYRADLLLVEGDPTTDITATQNIQRVWAGGVEYAAVA